MNRKLPTLTNKRQILISSCKLNEERQANYRIPVMIKMLKRRNMVYIVECIE